MKLAFRKKFVDKDGFRREFFLLPRIFKSDLGKILVFCETVMVKKYDGNWLDGKNYIQVKFVHRNNHSTLWLNDSEAESIIMLCAAMILLAIGLTSPIWLSIM